MNRKPWGWHTRYRGHKQDQPLFIPKFLDNKGVTMTFEKDTTCHHIPKPSGAIDERKKHIEWCKGRAREYLRQGQCDLAVASMISDMNSREDCQVSMPLAQLGVMLLLQGRAEQAIKDFIEGFN
jgi:hypothetical protein